MGNPYPHPESPNPGSVPQQSFPPPGGPHVPSPYPWTLPPPVEYPSGRRRRRRITAVLGLLMALVVAAAVTTSVLAERGPGHASPGALNQDSAKAAIQDYLDALAQGKNERIAEHASCGLFDAIKDRRADMSLANLASDAFRRQFSNAQVSSIDKVVMWSPNQAQVLFTMKATRASASKAEVERQAVAQLLIQDPEILVCSYLPRNAGPL
jgi:hypothetical protein